ncbi:MULTISPECIES: helix-turn-helix transcriptional regulator [Lactococcus]|uniref:Putative transcriptional regulator n=1 Tax=Lactococcus lactis subsp. cremoris TaxID=1359 RepID=A0A166J123_LACLC|nr:helix-turn-helix transcriptional regulator [Lactococcus cremoris]KZK05363.1 putative transcriptional regulator [Lactococcus cremoris]
MESNFYQRLRDLAKASKKSFNKIEREMNYPRNALHNYKEGRDPSGTRVVELAHYFGVTPEYLLGKELQPKSTSANFLFKSLSIEEKKEMCLLCYEWLLVSK